MNIQSLLENMNVSPHFQFQHRSAWMVPDAQVKPLAGLKYHISQASMEWRDILHTWSRAIVSNHKIDLHLYSTQEFSEYPIV